jgi:DNA invertase Pin-like site-specific DNA recombinase
MKAYSYSRYSSDAQTKGNSIERQQTSARKWCAKNEIALSDQVYADEAVSGFHGDNVRSGALGEFIRDVETGVIERGSYLILENLDRLTRIDPWDAVALLRGILELGISVVTLKPEMIFDPEKRDSMQLMQAVMFLDNAHKESERKSGLGKDEWAKRFERARSPAKHHIGRRVSNWLTLGDDGQYRLNERAVTVKRIFELCLQGLGSTAVSQVLNAEGHTTFNKGERWGTTAVLSILQNRAAIGELALKDGGEPVSGYFPAVVDTATFEAAHAKITARKTGSIPKQSADFNVWGKLVFCGACGSAMHIIQRTKFKYLMCANKRYGQCDGARNVRLDESEDVFLCMLRELDALHFAMPDPERLSRELTAAEGRLLLEQDNLTTWIKRVAQHPKSESFANLMLTAERLVAAALTEVERLKAELAGSGDKLSLAEVRAKVDMKDKDMRRRANAFLHRLGVKVHIADGYLVTQGDEARAMFAVSKNRIGCQGLEGDPGDIPDLVASNAIAATVKTLLDKPGSGFVYRGDVTTPNGRGTRRVKADS